MHIVDICEGGIGGEIMHNDLNHYQVNVGLSLFWSMTVIFVGVCGTTTIALDASALAEVIAEVEVGNDAEVSAADASAPQVCVQGDLRPACQARPGALDLTPFKIKSEGVGQCLRPSGGSTQENVAIMLSNCESTQSRFWIQKRAPYGLGFQLENMKSGKCIQRVGSQLLQRTCALGGRHTRYQTWNFKKTAPLGSGNFLRSWTGCASAIGNVQAQMAHCINDSHRRWYQTAN